MRLLLTSSNRPSGIRRNLEPLSPGAGRGQSPPPYCAWRVVRQQERRAHFNLRYSAMCDELRFGDSPSICFSTGLIPERYSSSAWYTVRVIWNVCYRFGAFLRRAFLHSGETPRPVARRPYLTGAAVRSDHLPMGTMNTSIGSGAPPNWGFSMTGEWGRSAPQTAPSMSGV